jgi:hypothetical protein
VLFVVTAVIAIPFGLSLVAGLGPTENEKAKLWVASLDAAKLAEAVTNIQTLAVAKQRAVLNLLPAKDRAAFWVSRLNGLRRGASVEASATIQQAIDLLSSEAYVTSPVQFREREKQITRDLVRQLGPGVLAPLSRASAADTVAFSESPIAWLRARVTVYARMEDCDCSESGPGSVCSIIGSPQDCRTSAPCNPVEEGCWVSWIEKGACTGLCMGTTPGGGLE